MLRINLSKEYLLPLIFIMVICFCLSATVSAQNYWTALPPYNTLWPLWSPALSPADPTTGVLTPVITNLAPSTVLPVQPGLTWNPYLDYPWLLYNTPVGLSYFDPLYGINFWPPPSFLNASGAAIPLDLTPYPNYNLLPPTSTAWLQQNVLFANSYFLQAYPSLLATADPAALAAAALAVPLPPAVVGALAAGLPVAGLGVTIFPPPDILSFLTPAAILGL